MWLRSQLASRHAGSASGKKGALVGFGEMDRMKFVWAKRMSSSVVAKAFYLLTRDAGG